MSIQRRNRLRAVAVIVGFALVQAYIQLSFAGPTTPSSTVVLPQAQLLARLTTGGNRPILINGSSASSGDSVGTNAIIETPPGTDATIDLGPLGKIDIPAGSKIKLEFECPPEENLPSANDPAAQAELDKKCKAKVTVMAGCVAATGGKKGNIEIVTDEKGRVGDTDDEKKKKGGAGFFSYCFGLPVGGAAGGGGGGIGAGATAGIVSGVIATPFIVWWVAHEGGNPSSSTPTNTNTTNF